MDPILLFEGVHIFPFDVDTLNPGGLLNDAILDFYMKYLYHVVLAENQRPKIEICDSFFHQQIVHENPENTESQEIHMLDKDFILLPVNVNEHWFLVIICYPRNILGNYETIDVKEVPRIIILDSSVGFLKHTPFLKKLHHFIQKQIVHESGKSINDLPNRLPTDFVPVAQQSNDYDCGLFLLEFAEKFILDNFPSSINSFTQMSNDDAIDCNKKRQTIRELIEHLSVLAHYNS